MFPYPKYDGKMAIHYAAAYVGVFAVSSTWNSSDSFWFVGLIRNWPTLRDSRNEYGSAKLFTACWRWVWRGSRDGHWPVYSRRYICAPGPTRGPPARSLRSYCCELSSSQVAIVPAGHIPQCFPQYFVAGLIYSVSHGGSPSPFRWLKHMAPRRFHHLRHPENMSEGHAPTGLSLRIRLLHGFVLASYQRHNKFDVSLLSSAYTAR